MKLKQLVLVSLFACLFMFKAQAQNDVNNAQAVFIYNFLSHIKWPEAEVSSKYVIGVYGNTSTLGYLKSYTMNRKVGNKPIEIIEITSATQAQNCNVLFVARNKSAEIGNIKNLTASRSCLIISEKPGTTALGAVVDFHITNNKLRYKLDEENAKEQNLYVSKALLTMSL